MDCKRLRVFIVFIVKETPPFVNIPNDGSEIENSFFYPKIEIPVDIEGKIIYSFIDKHLRTASAAFRRVFKEPKRKRLRFSQDERVVSTMKSVTLKDVAKAANVSYATVSRALSGSPQIGSDTRERILKLCDEMGYTTNYVARSMVMKKTDVIGLVVPSIDNQFMSELAYYAEMSARNHGYNIMLCNSGPDLKQEKTVVKLLMGRQVDGILIVPQSPKTYENIRAYTDQVPTVFLSENLRDQPQSYVAVDNSYGTYLGVEYLYGLGHREILYFGRRQTTTHQLRAEGYMRACRKFGLRERFFNSEFSRSSIENGYQMAKELFSKPVDYTAIFASTDSNALGILKAADELGIDIPGRLSLIGFDNIRSTGLPRIELTTIEQPKREMAVQAVDMLRDKIENGTKGYVHQILMPSLIERGSCHKIN